MNDNKKKKDNDGFGLYLNHEGVNFGYGIGHGTFLDSDGFHFGALKL